MICPGFLATYSFSSLSGVTRQSILPRRTLQQKTRVRGTMTKCSSKNKVKDCIEPACILAIIPTHFTMKWGCLEP